MTCLFRGVIWRSVWRKGRESGGGDRATLPRQTQGAEGPQAGRQAAVQQLLCAQWPLLFSSPLAQTLVAAAGAHWTRAQPAPPEVTPSQGGNTLQMPLKATENGAVTDYTEGTQLRARVALAWFNLFKPWPETRFPVSTNCVPAFILPRTGLK